jgi:hypothetical protein
MEPVIVGMVEEIRTTIELLSSQLEWPIRNIFRRPRPLLIHPRKIEFVETRASVNECATGYLNALEESHDWASAELDRARFLAPYTCASCGGFGDEPVNVVYMLRPVPVHMFDEIDTLSAELKYLERRIDERSQMVRFAMWLLNAKEPGRSFELSRRECRRRLSTIARESKPLVMSIKRTREGRLWTVTEDHDQEMRHAG